MAEIGHWEDDPAYPISDWKYEVENNATRVGYHEWRNNKRAADTCQCQRNDPPSQREPGKHKPWCTINPAYRPGDWS
jgi:hypothetical protein